MGERNQPKNAYIFIFKGIWDGEKETRHTLVPRGNECKKARNDCMRIIVIVRKYLITYKRVVFDMCALLHMYRIFQLFVRNLHSFLHSFLISAASLSAAFATTSSAIQKVLWKASFFPVTCRQSWLAAVAIANTFPPPTPHITAIKQQPVHQNSQPTYPIQILVASSEETKQWKRTNEGIYFLFSFKCKLHTCYLRWPKKLRTQRVYRFCHFIWCAHGT